MEKERVRKPKALLDAEKKIDELEKKLKSETQTKEYLSKNNQELTAVVDGIHDVLDDLGIRRYRDETQRYNSIPLAVRLFSWAMKLSEPKK